MDVKELEKKTVAKLKEMAKEAGIFGISSMKKADLVAAVAGSAAKGAPEETLPAEEPASEPVAEKAPAPVEAQAADEGPDESALEPEPEVKTVPVEAAAEEAPATEEAPAEVPAAEEPAPEPEPQVETAPVKVPAAAAVPAPAPAPAKKAEPVPEPPKPEAVPSRAQVRLQEKYDIPALKDEKRSLQSQILAAIAQQDYKKLKELRGRKKELRRLLNRV